MTKQDLKIVFLGTPEFAVESLRSIVDAGYNVAAVVTMPDKVGGRGHKLIQSPVKQFALERNLPVLQPTNLKDPEFVQQLRDIDADLFVVIAFRMLPEVVWSMPRLGTFNLHGSLLPRYRGAAPINRAVMNGEKETGVTTFFLKHEIDTGDVIDRRSMPIADDEDAGSVHDRMMMLGAELAVSTLDRIVAGNLTAIPQDQLGDPSEMCPAPKIFKEDCKIDWSRPTAELHNHVRGLAPYPGSWTQLIAPDGSSQEVKVLKARVADGATAHDGTTANEGTAAAPGQLIIDGNRLLVNTGCGTLELLEVQPAGKRRMAVDAWLRGARLDGCSRFE